MIVICCDAFRISLNTIHVHVIKMICARGGPTKKKTRAREQAQAARKTQHLHTISGEITQRQQRLCTFQQHLPHICIYVYPSRSPSLSTNNTVDGINCATLWSSGALQMVRHKKHVLGIENPI